MIFKTASWNDEKLSTNPTPHLNTAIMSVAEVDISVLCGCYEHLQDTTIIRVIWSKAEHKLTSFIIRPYTNNMEA